MRRPRLIMPPWLEHRPMTWRALEGQSVPRGGITVGQAFPANVNPRSPASAASWRYRRHRSDTPLFFFFFNYSVKIDNLILPSVIFVSDREVALTHQTTRSAPSYYGQSSGRTTPDRELCLALPRPTFMVTWPRTSCSGTGRSLAWHVHPQHGSTPINTPHGSNRGGTYP